MIKTFHEAPKAIFKDVQKVTDGDYALVHLFSEDEEYFELFAKAVADGREVILDNSVFELGKAFQGRVYASWIELLRPTWYIVPDVLEDAQATVAQFNEFVAQFPELPGKRIGVVQGKSLSEVIWCYEQIELRCDMVAFSFDFSWYKALGPPEMAPTNPWMRSMQGRINLLSALVSGGFINKQKPHHLLGCALPQEMIAYKIRAAHSPQDWSWVYSVDTSNPVVHGIKGITYEPWGLHDKESQKLCELIDYVPTPAQRKIIFSNIKAFRRFCNG